MASGSRFQIRRSHGQIALTQFSSMDGADTRSEKKQNWPVPQLALYDNPKAFGWRSGWEEAAYAHTIQKDNKTWGNVNVSDDKLAHPLDKMSCQTCHSSWVPSCFGCHLPMKANMRRPILHYNGDMTRNWTSYNFQTLRNDVFMIAKDGAATGNRISPARSSCAVEVSSYNANREVITLSNKRFPPKGSRGRHSALRRRTRCAARKPSSAPTAICLLTTTTMQRWRNC